MKKGATMKRNLFLLLAIGILLTVAGSLAAFTVTGTVTDASTQTAITGAQVVLYGEHSQGQQPAMTDSTGAFSFADLNAGHYQLVAGAQGYQVFHQEINLTEDTIVAIALTANGQGGGQGGEPGTLTLSGTVTDASTQAPLAGVQVVLCGEHNQGQNVTTDDTGAFSFTALNAGDYELAAGAEGYQAYHQEINLTEDTTVAIALTADGQGGEPGTLTLSGTVTSSETGEALAGIFLHLHGNQIHQGVRTAEDGSYSFSNLVAGDYELTVHGEHSQALYEETITLTESTVHDIVIGATASTASLSGTVTDASTGTALAGVVVSLFCPPMYGFYEGETTTDSTGAYSFASVPDGVRLHVTAHMEGYQPSMQDVQMNGDTVVDIALNTHSEGALGTINGVVTYDEDGTPVQGAVVHLIRVAEGQGHHDPHFEVAVTNENGEYQISAPAGTYYAVCMIGADGMAGGYLEFFDNALSIDTATALTVEENVAVNDIDFGVPANPADAGAAGSYVTGLITDLNGNPVSSATTYVQDSDGTNIGSVTTDENGVYEVDNLVSGDAYTIVAQSSNNTPVTAGFTHEGMISVVDLSFNTTTETEDNNVPASVLTVRNAPNPFNPETSIVLSMPSTAVVKLNVYNARGQLVRTLLNGEVTAGSHSVTWNGTDNNGQAVSSGLYFYRVETKGLNIVRKMTLLK